ncbi:MAG: hypothetical protein HGB19_07765 [Chlorobiales bacterium]|nr:hypothetical protein [Chlorobiales bacterium]
MALLLTLFRSAVAVAQEEPHESILARVEKVDLITVSALNTNAGEVQNLPATLFSLITLIDSKGIVVSTKREDNSLINKVERFSLVSKGTIPGENALGAKGFEVAFTADGETGKLLIYSDSMLTSPAFYIRWRHVVDETEYLRRTFQDGTIREELLVLRRDGSGYYQAGQRGKRKEKVRWNADGKTLQNDEKR